MNKKLLFLCVIAFLGTAPSFVQAKEGNQSREQTAAWLSAAAVEVMSFGFYDFDERKLKNKAYFTDAGYSSFYLAMDRSRIPETVKNNQQIVTANLTCAPELKAPPEEISEKFAGVEWVAKFPLELIYQEKDRFKKQNLLITTFLAQKEGSNLSLGIQQWVAAPATDEEMKNCSEEGRKKAEIDMLEREINKMKQRIEKLQADLPAEHDF